jgi:hypothetical protein
MPNQAVLLGVELTMQVILADPGAGPPAPGLSFTNGLSLTIVQ